MNNQLWTIMRIPEQIAEGSEQERLLQRFPTPTVFLEKAYVFCSSLEDAAEPMTVELTEDNSLEEIAVQIETYLDDNNTRCVWLKKGLASQLYKILVSPTEADNV
jgi:hypothetical protein